MRSRLFKSNIESEIFGLKEGLALLQLVQEDTERIALEKAREKKTEIDKITATGQLSSADAAHYEAFFNYGFHFQFVVIHSLVVSAFALFEDFLYQVTRWLDDDPMTTVPLDKRWGLKEYRKHFCTEFGLDTTDGRHPSWQQIIIFEKIRNLIVHHHNRFDGENSKPALIRLLKKYDVHIRRDHEFRIKDRRFVDDIATAMSTFADDIADEIYRKM
jgi:hypothetical protein